MCGWPESPLDFVPSNQFSSSSLPSSSDLSSRFCSRSVRILRLLGDCSSDRSPFAASMRPSACRSALSNWPMSHATEIRSTGVVMVGPQTTVLQFVWSGTHTCGCKVTVEAFVLIFLIVSEADSPTSAPCLISAEENKFSVVRQSRKEFLRHFCPIRIQTNMCTRKWQLEMKKTWNYTRRRIIQDVSIQAKCKSRYFIRVHFSWINV